MVALLVAGVLVGSYMWLALEQPFLQLQPTVSLQVPTQAASKVSLDWPDYGESAIGAAGYGVLATSGDQKPLPTASIAKVMTALAVLRQRPLQLNEQGPTLTLGQADVDSYNSFVARDGSVVPVALGEQITEYQALQALLLPSANNIADTLARWAFGSISSYNTYANAYAKQLGLTSMHITDPSGYELSTVASAHDLTLLGSLAMLHPVFAQIVAQPRATIPVAGTITNYNFMLGENGNVGIKTGNNDGNKGAFLFASKQQIGDQTVTIVGTIMGGPDLSTVLRDSNQIITSATAGFSKRNVISDDQEVGWYRTPTGEKISVRTAGEDITAWNGFSYGVRANLKPIKLPAAANSRVGDIALTVDGKTIAPNPVTLSRTIPSPNLWWCLTHPFGR
jgi:D-alanyl-D-alanine carboxypeptidase (penicillin-binding protein 5/6)